MKTPRTANKAAADPLAFAKSVRSVLLDKTGDEDWARVPASKIPLPDGPEDAEAAADWLLDEQGCEPHHFLEE